MTPSIIIYGSPDCDMERYAERIARHFKAEKMLRLKHKESSDIRFYRGFSYKPALIFFEGIPNKDDLNGELCHSFSEVAEQINDAIPRTERFDGGQDIFPSRIGEYNASILKDPDAKRFWNGVCFSCSYYDCEDETRKAYCRTIPSSDMNIFWRGLSEEPVEVKA
ncbi:MAG: hypothetical protein JO269_09775 [Burkholderiaceae bacterium]|nr:hypothetical protein [Burkholderiaceae bacterium]